LEQRIKHDRLFKELLETFFVDEIEQRKLEEEMGKMDEKEASRMIELTTSWEEKGRSKGRIEGKIEGRIEGKIEGQADMLVRQLKKKFSNISAEMENKVRSLPADRLQVLADAIFDLETIEDVRNFLG